MLADFEAFDYAGMGKGSTFCR